MSPEERAEKIKEIFSGSAAGGIKQLFSTAGIAVLSAFNPFWALVGIPLSFSIDWFINRSIAQNQNAAILSVFKPELAALTGLSREQLTPELVGTLIKQNKHNPQWKVFAEIDDIRTLETKTRSTKSLIGTLLTVAAVFSGAYFQKELMQSIGVSLMDAMSFITVASSALTGAYGQIGAVDTKEEYAHSNYKVVMEIHAQAKVSQVQPLKILEAFVSAQEELQQKLEQRFKTPYRYLSYANKVVVLKELDPMLHCTQIAQKINQGLIRPTEVAWLSYGIRSGVPEKTTRVVSPGKTQEADVARSPTHFVDQVLAESSRGFESRTVH